MNGKQRIRQFHRWLSMIFTVTVVATFVTVAVDGPIAWVAYIPLLPLLLLMATGLYLFALPYLAKRRRGSAALE